jgi:hypothetical protein
MKGAPHKSKYENISGNERTSITRASQQESNYYYTLKK